MRTFWVRYIDEKGEEKEISASGSDAYSFAQEIEEETDWKDWYGRKIIDSGWRSGF